MAFIELTTDLVQPIVERAVAAVGHNINVMNHKGEIVGSGTRERLGTVHEGALVVLRTGQPLEIEPEQEALFKGTRAGINLPLQLYGQLVGVVGITGTPAEVRPLASLLKIAVEAMLAQALQYEHKEQERIQRDALLLDLLMGWLPQDPNLLVRRARLLGLDLSMPRRVILIAPVLELPQLPSSNFDLQRRKALRKAYEVTTSMACALGPNPIVSMVLGDRILVLSTAEPKLPDGIRDWCRSLISELQRFGLRAIAAVGDRYGGLDGLQRSFIEATGLLIYGQQRARSDSRAPHVFTYEDFAPVLILNSCPTRLLAGFVEKVLGGLDKGGNADSLFETLRVLLDNDLSVSKAARQLYAHRQTVIYRLNRIRALTKRNPTSFRDAVQIYLALLARDLLIAGGTVQQGPSSAASRRIPVLRRDSS